MSGLVARVLWVLTRLLGVLRPASVVRALGRFRRLTAGLGAVAVLAATAMSFGPFTVSASAASTFNAEDYAQCANGAPPSVSLGCPDGWINGILQGSNSHYHENEVTPQRLEVSFDTAGQHSVELKYLDRTGGVHAYDSLTSWDVTQQSPPMNRCDGLPTGVPCVGGAVSSKDIPADPASVPPSGASISDVVSSHEIPGHFLMYGGTIDSVSVPTHDADVADPTKDDYAHITITFTIPATSTDNTVQLLFGGHIAAGVGPNGWGADLGASAIPGGNYHIKWDLTDGVSVGNRDNQLMSGAILPPENTSIVTSATAGPVTVSTSTYSISDTATVTPANAAGTVVFNAYGPIAPGATPPPAPDCSGSPAFTSTAVGVDTSTGVAGPVTFNTPDPGYYFWIASFTPTDTSKFTPVSGTCGDANETSLVIPASPTITTQASPATGTAGVQDTFGDTATFHNAVNPTGSVTFTLYSNDTCTTAVSGMSGSGTISAGEATYSNTWTPPAAGTYYWKASYVGDANNNSFTTSCGDANEQIVVGAATPGITTQAAPATGTAGVQDTFGDTATFDSSAVAPTGSVDFTLYANDTCTTAVSGMSGSGAITGSGPYSATFSKSWTPPAAGTYYWQAHYAGDSNNASFTTGCLDDNEQIVVGKASPHISTVADPNTGTATVAGTFGDTATFDDTAVAPTGSVDFTLYSDNTCQTAVSGMSGSGAITGSGPYSATFSKSWTPPAAGTYYWVAHYAGDANNNAFTTGCTDANEQIVVAPHRDSLTLTKAINANGDTVPPAGFVFSVSCSDGTTATLTFHGAGSQSVDGIIDGSTCDVTETPVTGWTSSPSGTQHVTVTLGGATVSFTNTRDTGVITVNKSTVGTVAGASTVFTFDVVCPISTFNQTLTIDTATQSSTTSTAIPTGMVCSVTERSTAGWQQTTPAQGGVDVTVPGTATFQNTRLTGPLQLSKSVVPSTGSYSVGDPNNTLTYTLSLSPTGSLDHTNVVVTDYIPGYDPSYPNSGNTTYVANSATCSAAGCTVSYDSTHHQLTWNVGNVNHDSAAVIMKFKVTIDQPKFDTSVGIPAETIDNIGFVRSTQQAKTPSNLVKTPVEAVLGIKVVRPPAVLPFTGMPIPAALATWAGMLMVGAGVALTTIRRRRRGSS